MTPVRSRALLLSSVLVTMLMLVGVGVVGHDALMIREAEEIEEDAGTLLQNAEQWMNHQQAIEVALRDYLLFGNPASLALIETRREDSLEHVQAIQKVLGEHGNQAETQIMGLVKFTDMHQRKIDRIVAAHTGAPGAGASRALLLNDYQVFFDGAQLLMDDFSSTLKEKRSRVNSEVSVSVVRGSISFSLMALVMLAIIWLSYFRANRLLHMNAELAAQLLFEATHDALTGLPNRRYLQEHLGHAIDLAMRHRLRLAVMVIDLDGFKAINDNHGHELGDAVLREVGRRFKQTPRTSDFVVRAGGDEFVLVAENVDQENSLQHLAQRLIDCLAEPFDAPGTPPQLVGCSIGIAIYPDHADKADALLVAADRAMYLAKQSGKNCWRMSPTH